MAITHRVHYGSLQDTKELSHISRNEVVASIEDTRSPLQLMISECLLPPILSRYHQICTTLLTVIKDDYKLMDHLAAVRVRFYSSLCS